MPDTPPPRRTWLRRLGWAGLALVALEGLYLVAANGFLRSPWVYDLLNAKHRKVRVSAERLFTFFPGRWHATHLELRGRTATADWWLHADHASGWIDLAGLLRRRFALPSGEASGVRFRLLGRERPATSPELEAALPSLPETDIEAPGPLAPRSRKSRWRFELGSWRFREVREVWLDQFRLSGGLAAAGGYRVRLGEEAEVRPSRLSLAGAELHVGPRAVARGLAGELDVSLAPFRYREEHRWELSPHLDGRLELRGQLADLSFLTPFLRRVEWLQISGGEGPFALRLQVGGGRLQAGSSLDLPPRELAVSALGYEATGTGAVEWKVEAEPAGARLRAEMPRLSLRREGEAVPYLVGRDLTVTLATQDRTLDGRLALDSAVIDLAQGTVADLRAYNAYLPPRIGLALTGGTATVKMHAESADGQTGAGTIDLDAAAARLVLEAVHLRGNLALRTRFASADLRSRRFDLDGTTLGLSEVKVTGGLADRDGWWGKLALESAWAEPGRSPYFGATLDTHLRDSGPLIDLLTARKPLPKMVQRALTVANVRGNAALTVAKDGVALDSLHVRGEKLQLDARLRLRPGHRSGQVLARYGELAVGLDLADGERDWVLLHARRWFEETTGIPIPEPPR